MPVSPVSFISPDVTRFRPFIHLSRVLLPEPEGPIIATISPFFMEKFTLSTALVSEPSYYFTIFFISRTVCRSIFTADILPFLLCIVPCEILFQSAGQKGQHKGHNQIYNCRIKERLHACHSVYGAVCGLHQFYNRKC